jgi:hypothetical protein
MFLLNVGYRWNLAADLSEVQATIYLAAGSIGERLRRQALPEKQRLLFDPQLYLAGLDPDSCQKTCARLASYPWFGVNDIPSFDSAQSSLREWEAAIRGTIGGLWPRQAPAVRLITSLRALDFQLALGCTHIILPSPLIADREDEAQTQAEWLDSCLEAAQELEVGQPVLATVAVADSVLNAEAFNEGGFLDIVADQITARDGLDGVYIVIANNVGDHPFRNSPAIQRAYLHLSSAFAARGYETVLTNFADVFGLVCLGAGATGFASGPSQSLRRLAISAFRDEGGGIALPHFYSHRVIGEFLSETELDRYVQRNLLRRIRDNTPYSVALMDALQAGRSASAIQGWAESQNNLATSQKHFLHRLSLEDQSLMAVSPADRLARVREWLEEAEAGMLLLKNRFGESVAPGAFAPADSWSTLLP